MAKAEPTQLPFWVASAVGSSALCLLDLFGAFGGGSVADARTCAWAIGLSGAGGAVHGLAWDGVASLVRRAPRRALAWPALALVGALWLAADLGAFAKLAGKDADLAAAALVLCLLAATGLGASAWLVAPRGDGRGRVLGWSRPRRGAVVAGFVAVALACTWMDRTQFVGLYPSAHLALRMTTLWMVMLGLVVVWPWRALSPKIGRGLPVGVVVVGLAWPLASLDASKRASLQSMLDRPFASLSLRGWQRVFDLDRDGYPGLLGGGDCDDLDPNVGPGAAEIPGNGIDDNCVLGDAIAEDLDFEDVPRPDDPSPTSVVLITVDALRADHVQPYGYARETTPHLQAWSERALVFEHAFTAGSLTVIAMPALHRGVYARRLRLTAYGLTNHDRFLPPEQGDDLERGEVYRWFYGLPRDDPRRPLAWWLQRRGMTTAAVIDDGGNGMLAAGPGSDVGFDTYVDTSSVQARGDDQLLADRALATLEALPSDRPFFLWVHFYGTHLPHAWHDEVPRFGDDATARYDHEIAFADLQIGRLLAAIEARQAEQPIATILTSDHGEILEGEVRVHGASLRDDTLRVPLMLQLPGGPTGRVSSLASIVDVFPTIMGLTRTPAPPGLDGIDLRTLVDTPRPRELIADLWRFYEPDAPQIDMSAAFDGEHRLVLNRKFNSYTLERQDDLDSPNLIREVAAPHLEQLLLGYLEETGGEVVPEWTD